MTGSPRRRALACVLTAAALVLSITPAGAAEPTGPQPSRRLGNSDDVVAAAIDVSARVWRDASADRVVLARDDVFADSLAGAALAGTSGPILFTPGGPAAALPPAVEAEIARVLPAPNGCDGGGEVDLLGGTAAISSTVEGALRERGYCVVRIAGDDRVSTAVQIAEHADDASQVLLARSDTWPDSAAAGAYAAATGHPILVTPSGALAPEVAAYLEAVHPSEIVLLGGSAALSAAVEEQAGRHGPTTRVQGTTRDATAAAIASSLWGPRTPRGIALADGWASNGWAYAIAGSVVGALEGAPVLLVHPTALTDADQRHLDGTDDTFTIAVGPPSHVSDAVVQAVDTSRAWQLIEPPGTAPVRYRDAVFTNVSKTAGIAYGSAVDRSGTTVTLRLDLYRPAGDTATSRPAIVWVHGGGFSGGDRTSPEIVDEANTFARRGYVNVSINYRLEKEGCSASAPTGACVDAIREAMEDAQTAVRFLRANASTYGIDTTRIAIAGSSAGAITALNVGYMSSEDPSSAVQAAVSLSGANILGQISPGDAPALLLHGTQDSLVPYSWAEGTVRDARAKGLLADLTTWEGAGHVPYVEFHDEIIEQTSSFLWWMLDPSAAG
jgi:acetyl esterase/lipase/putative cell wall-binding protein